MGEKNNDQSIMDKSMRSVFGKFDFSHNSTFILNVNSRRYLKLYYSNANLIHFVFTVGNIPYEATEEKLKEIFSEVGPVLSLKWVLTYKYRNSDEIIIFFNSTNSRLVFDRESGKPKGYGFCEYKDQETALSAMR